MSTEVCICRECGENFYDWEEVDNHPCPMAKPDPRDTMIAELRAEVERWSNRHAVLIDDVAAQGARAARAEADLAKLQVEVERLHKSYDAQVECTRYAGDDWKREHDRAERAEAALLAKGEAVNCQTKDDAALRARLAKLKMKFDQFRSAVHAEGMSGSPGEWMVEEMDMIETELARRARTKVNP